MFCSSLSSPSYNIINIIFFIFDAINRQKIKVNAQHSCSHCNGKTVQQRLQDLALRKHVCSPRQRENYYQVITVHLQTVMISKSLTSVFMYIDKSDYSYSHCNPPSCAGQGKVHSNWTFRKCYSEIYSQKSLAPLRFYLWDIQCPILFDGDSINR